MHLLTAFPYLCRYTGAEHPKDEYPTDTESARLRWAFFDDGSALLGVQTHEVSMQFGEQWRQLSNSRAGIRSRALGVVIKALAIVVSVFMLIGAIAVSIVFFAGVLLIGLAVGGYVWWRTRDVRAQVRAAQRDAAQGDSQIIEGEVIRKRVTDDKDES